MGAQSFVECGTGESARKVFDELYNDKKIEYGEDGYNGTISTCTLGKCTLKYDKYRDSNEKIAYKHIEDKDYGNKWVADYIDLGIIRYDVYTITKSNIEEKDKKARFKLKYVIKDPYSDKAYASYDTKTEADRKALEFTLKNNKSVFVSKEYILVSGKTNVTLTNIEIKSYKTEPKLKPMPNRKIVPIHKFIFYGWAAY